MEALSMNWKNCIFSECQMIFHNLEHPVSLWVNIMAERQGKEWKGNGEGVKEKKGKGEKAGGKGKGEIEMERETEMETETERENHTWQKVS